MPTESLRSYNAIIQHTLSQAIKLGSQSPQKQRVGPHGIAGFCQLQGPTGGGKSSSLYRKGHKDGVAPALEQIKDAGYQAILVTHRWNILHDIYESATEHTDSKGEKFKVSVLYAQDESIRSAVTRTPLPHENGLSSSDIPDPFDAIDDLDQRNLFIGKDVHRQISKNCKNVQSVDRLLRSADQNPALRKYIHAEKQSLRKACAAIERILLKNMAMLESEVQKSRKNNGPNKALISTANKRLADFRAHPWIRRIFPAIVWHDEKQHLLIMTTQKMFSSFYDGKAKVRMSSSELNGHVIFIDEFDYQADVLQQLLAQSQLVHEPPECLGQMLDGGRRLLLRMQHVSTDPVPEICDRLANLLDDLEEELKEKNINLSDYRALVVPVDQYRQKKPFGNQYLFRSDHLVTSNKLSMSRVLHGYEIKEESQNAASQEQSVNIGDFLRLMEQYIRRFSLMMSDFAASSTEDTTREYILKLNRLLFDPANDYRPSYYSSALPNASFFSLPRADLAELSTLRESNVLPNTHANIYGLTNWLLKQNVAELDLDPLRIQIRRAFLPTTSEGLLLSLASRNLVFALSATSYIERANCHFDNRWVNSALRYVAEARNAEVVRSYLGKSFKDRPESWFKKPIPYVQNDEDKELQQETIANICKAKAEIRKTQLQLTVQNFDTIQNSEDGEEVLASLPPNFFQCSDNPISDFVFEHRQNVFMRLLDVVNIAGTRQKHQGQLIFVNSTKYFRKWLNSQDTENSRNVLNWFEIDSTFTDQLPAGSILKDFRHVFVPVKTHGIPALICLLTAQCQKQKGFYDAYQEAFNTGRIVIVITQTASATNGINLDFSLPDSGKKMDLTCLYILETQHYYFSRFEQDEENSDEMAHAGYQLRNLEKLLRAGEISRKQHQRYILPLMTNAKAEISRLNNEYKRSDDYVKNTASDVQQQVGRVERAWSYVPEIEIHITREIAECLTRFASMPVFTSNRQLISDLTCQLLDKLLERNEQKGSGFFEQLMTPVQDGGQAVHTIDNVLIPAIRKSRISENNDQGIARLWKQLGKAILQFDFAWKPIGNDFGIDCELFKWACIEIPEKSIGTNKIWYDPGTWQFYSEPGDSRIKYSPGKLYERLQHHPAIVDWFNRMGYRTSIFPPANSREERYIYHPKVAQRLQQGRLGEEAVRAILDDKGIKTTTKLQDSRTLELYDFGVMNSPYRVDAKYWGLASQDEADEVYQQWVTEGANPESAPLGLIQKLLQIREAEGDDVKLAVINFVATRDDAPLLGFDYRLKPASVDRADILVLGGCVTSAPVTTYTPGLKHFVNLINANERDGESNEN